jgi:hypothetical protein
MATDRSLLNLADALVEDIMETSDQELAAECSTKELNNIALAMRLGPMEAAKEVVRLRSTKDKAANLHKALADLLDSFREMVRDTNSEPTFGEHPAIEIAERALFDNRPLED